MFKNFLNSKRDILGIQIADWALIVLAVAVYAFITLAFISKFSIWFDEAFSVYITRFNFLDIARYTATDMHPPLFYWLLKVWVSIFGNTEIGVRSMSVFFGCIDIVLGYLLVNRHFGKRPANLSLVFMALSPMLVRYGQEARMYTLVIAIALTATYILSVAGESKKRWPWIVYGILVGLGMWTHYYMAIVWISHWVWRADNVRRSAAKGEFLKKFFTKQWVMAHIVAVAVFLPWLPFMMMQFFTAQAYGFWIPPVSPNTITNFFTNTLYYTDSSNTTGWLALCFVALALVLGVIGRRIYKLQDEKHRRSYRLVMSLAFVPVILICLLSMPPLRSSFVDRYIVTASFSLSIFMGVTLGYGDKVLSKKWRTILTLFVAALLLFGVTTVWRLGNYNKNTSKSNNTRDIIQAVGAKASSGEPIIAATPWFFYEATFYSTNNHPVYFIEPSSYDYGSLDMLKYNDYYKIRQSVVGDFTKQHSTVWYVGQPGDASFAAPYSNWTKLREVKIKDSVTGKPSYMAIEYRTEL